MVSGCSDLLEAAAGDRAVRGFLGDGGIVRSALVLVVFLDEQPVILALCTKAIALHADECPVALELLAVEYEFELAVAQAFIHIRDRLPRALVPDHHGTAAVLAFRDGSLEAAVLDRVVLDLDGEALVGDDVARPLSDRPAFEHAAPAKAKVVVEARGGVLLNDEGKLGFSGFGFGAGGAAGLRGHGEVAHGAIAGQLLVDLFSR